MLGGFAWRRPPHGGEGGWGDDRERKEWAAALWGSRVADAARFVTPFVVLLADWAVLVPAFRVPFRLFPSVRDVLHAARQEIQRGPSSNASA